MKWRVVVASVICSISLLLLVSCGGEDGQTIRGIGGNTSNSGTSTSTNNANSGSSQTNEDASVAATALASRILSPQSADDAQQAVSQVLAWAGIGTMANGSLQPAMDPTLPTFVAPAELAFLTQDASLRADESGQMTLVEFADTLQQSGAWDASGSTDPGQTLLDVLRDALTLAKQQPHDTHSFVPLFLAAMAQHGSPGKALDDPTTLPTDVVLSALEQELFLSAMLRGDQSYPVPTAAAAAVRIAAASGTPPICDQFLQSMGPLQGFESAALGAISPSPFTKLFEKFGVASPKINALSNLLNVLKVIVSSIDSSVSFRITPDPTEQRKPDYYNSDNYIKFTADVSVDGAQRDPSKLSELDSCAQALGYTLPDTTDMIAQQINSWRVMWYPLDGTGNNQWATDGWDHNNFLETQPVFITAVASDAPDHGTSDNSLKMNHQPTPYGPFIETGKIRMRAELDQSGTPGFVKDLFSMVTGNVWEGAVSAITDVLTHWYQRVATQKAYATAEGEQFGPPAYVTFQYQEDAPCNLSVRGSGYIEFSSDVTPPAGAKQGDSFIRIVGSFIDRIPNNQQCGTITEYPNIDYLLLDNITDGSGVQSVPEGEEATEGQPPDQEVYPDTSSNGSIHIGRFFSIYNPITVKGVQTLLDTVTPKDTINDIVLEAKEGATVTVPLQGDLGSMTYTYTEKKP
jgi:hypothetical protein